MAVVFRPLVERRTYRELVYLLSGAPLAAAWFGLLLAGWLAVGLLAVTPLVVPALLALPLGDVARRRGGGGGRPRRCSTSTSAFRVRAPSERGYSGRIRVDALRRDVLGAAVVPRRCARVLGFGIAVGVASVVGASLWLVALPVDVPLRERRGRLRRARPHAWRGFRVRAARARRHRRLRLDRPRARGDLVAARPLLSRSRGAAARAPSTEMQALLRRMLPVHAAFYAGLNVVLSSSGRLTTRAYFWPEWTLMSARACRSRSMRGRCSSTAAIRAASRGRVRSRSTSARRRSLFLFFVGVWAVTTRAYFWPMWPALGLAVVVGLHALTAMTKRIDVLTTTRAGAVNAAEDELRRIERDLHDGAQARLVALGMSIGMAEQKLATTPRRRGCCSRRRVPGRGRR